MTKSESITPAGERMLRNYLDLEAGRSPVEFRRADGYSTRMVDVLVNGTPARGMVLARGDGGAKAAARRLEKDGLAIVRWNTERLFIITDLGRSLMAPPESEVQ